MVCDNLRENRICAIRGNGVSKVGVQQTTDCIRYQNYRQLFILEIQYQHWQDIRREKKRSIEQQASGLDSRGTVNGHTMQVACDANKLQ